MKNLILLAMFLSAPAWAWKAYFSVTASGGAPIPAAFSASNSQSHVLTAIARPGEATLCVFNDTTVRMILDTVEWSAAPTNDTIKIPASGWACSHGITSDVYLRGESSTTSGQVYGWVE